MAAEKTIAGVNFPDRKGVSGWLMVIFIAMAWPHASNAIPLYARQTGQDCSACHAGGQYPELTSYGRRFKLTGYTLGARVPVPLAGMAVASLAKVASHVGSAAPATDFPRDGQPEFTTASLFCCGRITDNIGTFIQWTYDVYDHQDDQGHWRGKGHIDQLDLRYANQWVGERGSLIYGLTLNNNPGVSDVWNTFNSSFTPVSTYTPTGNALASTVPFDVPAVPFDQSLGQVSAGVSAYGYWNDRLYAEVGAYRAATGVLSILGESLTEPFSALRGTSAYWRVALSHDWSGQSVMLGAHGLDGSSYYEPRDRSSPAAHWQDLGVDGQYQYLLDPHAVTAMFSYTHEKQRYDDRLWNAANPAVLDVFGNARNSLDYWRLKLTYSYRARYGASLARTTVSGSADALAYPLNGSARPDSRLWIPEAFVQPNQYVRVGLQYRQWDQYQGKTRNYDPEGLIGRNASDNNTWLLYFWVAR